MSTQSGIKNHWGYKSLVLNGDAAHTLSVNTGNGNLVVSVTDFTYPGRVPLVFMRTYNSTNTTDEGLLGKGWQFGFEERLITQDPIESDVTYIDTTGAEWVFSYNLSTSEYEAPPGMFCKLELTGPTQFTLTMLNGFKRFFYFENPGDVAKLEFYSDNNGNGLHFDWNGDELTKIWEDRNATVDPSHDLVASFTYNVTGKLTNIDFGDSLQYHLEYSYTTSDELETATRNIDSTNNCIWTYSYNTSSGYLETIADPKNPGSTPTYFTGIAYSGSQVQTITDYDNNNIAFAYVTFGSIVTTTITDRRSKVTTNTHNANFDFALTQVALPSSINSYSSYAWDTQLRLTSYTDFNRNTTIYTYKDYTDWPSDHILSIDVPLVTENYLFTYDETKHVLLTATTPMGNTTVYSYDSNRNLTDIKRPIDGEASYHFFYNSHGDLTLSEDPCGNQVKYTYDEVRGCLLSSSRQLNEGNEPRSLTKTFEYDAECIWMVKENNEYSDADGNGGTSVAYDRDLMGRIKTTTVSGGEISLVTNYTYDALGNLETVDSPQNPGVYTTYTYTYQSWLKTIVYPISSYTPVVEYEYDEEGNLEHLNEYLDVTNSISKSYEYDDINRLLKITLPSTDTNVPEQASEYNYTYDAVGNLLTSEDACDVTTTYTYDALNRLETQAMLTTGQKYSYIYNDDNLLTDLIGQPDGPTGYEPRTYSYGYDDNGRLVTVTDPSEKTVWYRYYENDQLYQVTSPANTEEEAYVVREYEYDSLGRLTRLNDAEGESTEYTYRDDDLILQTTTAANKITKYFYDGVGRLARVDYPEDAYVEYTYDANSNITKVEGPDSFLVEYDYDQRDRLIEVKRTDATTNPNSEYVTTYTYDNLNRLETTLDPRQSLTEYVYDDHSRLKTLAIDADQLPTYTGKKYIYSYKYDCNGRLKVVTDPDLHTTTRVYNDAGQVTSVTFDDGTDTWTTAYEYDLWGMLLKKTNPDLTTEEYFYDELGRMIQQENYINELYTYGYDERGNNTSLAAPYGAVTSFTYNPRNELIVTSTTELGNSTATPVIENFAYDATGKLKTYTGPTTEMWTMQFDDLGRWIAANSSLGTSALRTYNPSNTLATSTDTSGNMFEMAYNGLRQRVSTTKAGETTPAIAYVWDYLDLTSITETDSSQQTSQHTFQYDRLGRITSHEEVRPTGTLTTTYDYNWRGQVTNRTLVGAEIEEDYTYDSRGLCTSIDYKDGHNVAFTYDAMGRQTTVDYGGYASRQYYYNLVGRMICDSILDASGNLYSTYYSYDRAGNRVSQVLDRRYFEQTIMPAIIPMDDRGNPVIQESVGGFSSKPLTGYTTDVYNAFSMSYPNLSLEIQTRTGGPSETEPYQKVNIFERGTSNKRGDEIWVYQDPISGDTIIEIRPEDPFPVEIPLSGHQVATPPTYADNCDIACDTRVLDFMGRVTDEDVQSQRFGPLQPTLPVVESNCVGKTGVGTGTTSLAVSGAGRAAVKNGVTFDKSLLSSGDGAVNQLSEPWAGLLDPNGDQQQKLAIAYVDNNSRKFMEDAFARGRQFFTDDNGKMTSLQGILSDVGNKLLDTARDAFGRITFVKDYGYSFDYDRHYLLDWKTGDVAIETDESTETSWAHQHFPGHSRIAIAYVPEHPIPEWELRGPQGQVKWRLDGEGNVTDFYGYSSWGNRISAQNSDSTQAPNNTRYLDGDLKIAPSMPQLKGGAGALQDMTPGIGVLEGAKEGGAAGLGSSANPDAGSAGNATFLQDNGTWSIGNKGGPQTGIAHFNPYVDPDTGVPVSEQGKPGMGTMKAPAGAPPAAIDQASIADQRMKDMWSAHSWKGIKVHLQTGSMRYDDYRNSRLPLPQQPKSRLRNPWNGFGPWDIPDPDPFFDIYPMPLRPGPKLPPSAWPMLPNEFTENFNEDDIAPSSVPGSPGLGNDMSRHGGNTPLDEADKEVFRGEEESDILNMVGGYILGEIAGAFIGAGIAGAVGWLGRGAASGVDDAIRASQTAERLNNVQGEAKLATKAVDAIEYLDDAASNLGKLGKHDSVSVSKKIAKQMRKRGWDDELISDTINNPSKVKSTIDNRFRPDGSGLRENAPATKYYRQDDSYVVINDKTGDVVQVSNRFDPNWIDAD